MYSPENDTFRKLARDLETPLFGLLMLGRLLAAPFFRTARRRAEGLVRREEFSGRCPVCHQPATQSKLRLDDGRRVLGCSLCDEEWLFPRITCPFCGTKEQSHFQVVYLDDDDLRWIATCDACHRYVKCIDQRKLGDGTPFSFFAEETASLSARPPGRARGLRPTVLAGSLPAQHAALSDGLLPETGAWYTDPGQWRLDI